jgi:hypothetical protein
MRCLADFLIDSDLCLKPDAAPLRVKAPDNDFSLTLSNAGGPEAPLDAVLSGQLFLEADSFENIRKIAQAKLMVTLTEQSVT